MKRTAALLGLALLMLLPGPALALAKENIGLSTVVAALENPFQSNATLARGGRTAAITDFQGNFFQQSKLVSLNRVQRGRGTVAVKFHRQNPGQVPVTLFRWDYSQPTNQEIVSDGQTLWVYLPENGQVIQSDISFTSRQPANNPVTFLTGLGNLSRDFNITWAMPNRDVNGNYVLELTPKVPSQLIQRLLLVVDKQAVFALNRGQGTGDTFPILSSTVYDPNGNTTTIEFSDIRVNRGIPDSFFHFMVPPGVEVVRPTGNRMGF